MNAPSDDKWAIEIGRFVMAFGSIEALTHEALRKCPRDDLGSTLDKLNLRLSQRLAILIAAANGRSDKEWSRVAHVLKEIQLLAGKRNLIAHNGVAFDLYIEDGELFFEEGIRDRQKRRPLRGKGKQETIEFEQLVQHTQAAQALYRELLHALEDAVGE